MKCALIHSSIYFFYNLPLKRHELSDRGKQGFDVFRFYLLCSGIRDCDSASVKTLILDFLFGLVTHVPKMCLMSTVLLVGLRSFEDFASESVVLIESFRCSGLLIHCFDTVNFLAIVIDNPAPSS